MSFEAMTRAIEKRMQDNWTATEVAYDNVEFDPPSNDYWVRLTVLYGTSDAQTIGVSGAGTLRVRDVGVITLQIFGPKDQSTRQMTALADTFKALYEYTPFDGIVPFAASLTNVGKSDDGWHQMNVTIPFRRDRNV